MSDGFLGALIWPPYVGLTTCHPGGGPLADGEPFDDPDYGRGLIQWRTEKSGMIVGRADILVPAGIYTYIAFFSGPHHTHPMMGESQPTEYAVVFNQPGVIALDPIQCGEYLPRGAV